MTLEGEYYDFIAFKDTLLIIVAILMTLEGEYYHFVTFPALWQSVVAILMTLEGEYYFFLMQQRANSPHRRNPHDIGRRILLSSKYHVF